MDSNSFLARFGIDPERISLSSGPIKTDDGFMYEAEEARDHDAECPFCHLKDKVEVNNHYISLIRCHQNGALTDFVRLRRIVYRCRRCRRSFTIRLSGISEKKAASEMMRNMIITEFSTGKTFAQIAKEYHVSSTYIIDVFDSCFKSIRRLSMPRVMCIDEFRFSSQCDQKYCCHLLDYETGKTVDIVKSRQKAYLEEYFAAMPEGERRKVRWICSDMYDEYADCKRKYFPGAKLVIDHFHVVCQLTEAINQIRAKAMKGLDQSTMEYRFMKSRWRLFVCRRTNIPDRWMTSKATGEARHYDELLKSCLKESRGLSEGYDALQSLLDYKYGEESYTDASKFIGFMSQKLLNCSSDLLKKAGSTYRRWRNEIAMGLCRNDEGLRLTNAKMEATNNLVKTVIKEAYGYRNFERFRKRALLILWGKKR